VSVSKFSPPIPHTLGKVGIVVRLARADLGDDSQDASVSIGAV
jgi:hypothetical protein